jgi:hypothetical protein
MFDDPRWGDDPRERDDDRDAPWAQRNRDSRSRGIVGHTVGGNDTLAPFPGPRICNR